VSSPFIVLALAAGFLLPGLWLRDACGLLTIIVQGSRNTIVSF
jgi:hypothetical protein